MKTRFFLNIALIATAFSLFAGCAASPAANAGADELDAAIREASTYLNGKVPGGSTAVFLNIKSDYPDLSEYILNVLSENAVNDDVFFVVDRQQLDTIRAELDFQMSGEVSDESAQSIGQMLGAQTIVSGAVSRIGPLYRVQVKAIEVQSAGVQGQWSRSVPRGPIITALTENYAPVSAGTVSAAVPSTRRRPSASGSPAAPAQAPAAPVYDREYKIGDTGPAGGIIFYDKKVATNGWRYLEATPVEMEWTNIQWGAYGGNVGATGTAIGTGRQNTQVIVDYLRRTGENDRAAQLCDAMEYGGYNDWFLPSRDELNFIYQNLKQRNLGGFSSDWYWSSSESLNYGHTTYAWGQRFSDGGQYRTFSDYANDKNTTSSVRAIRAF